MRLSHCAPVLLTAIALGCSSPPPARTPPAYAPPPGPLPWNAGPQGATAFNDVPPAAPMAPTSTPLPPLPPPGTPPPVFPPPPRPATVPNSARVIAAITADFRRCYSEGVKKDPNMEGSVELRTTVGPSGEVAAVSAENGKGLSDEVVRCLGERVKRARFDPPEGGSLAMLLIRYHATVQGQTVDPSIRAGLRQAQRASDGARGLASFFE